MPYRSSLEERSSSVHASDREKEPAEAEAPKPFLPSQLQLLERVGQGK